MVVTRSQTRSAVFPSQKFASVEPVVRRKPQKSFPSTQIGPLRPQIIPQPDDLAFTLRPAVFGLIQERICDSLYALCVQVILWNQTHGLQARPILFQLLGTYPTPEALADAPLERLTTILQPIGLHNIRAARLIALANTWLSAPPSRERRYRKLHYPSKGSGADVKPGEILGPEDEREGWEIAHLPGMGAYALDSYRIFYRDRLRCVVDDEPEWTRVLPLDKDLRRYLVWRWQEYGWSWDMHTGKRKQLAD
jgi:methyl-CpG-binding domain protein 4